MSNIATQSLSAEQVRFINQMSSLLTPWGMPPTMANLYAYLLIVADPVDLDTAAAQLDMAKSSVSVAARALERHALARRHTEPGTKRVRYGASDRFSGHLTSQAALLGDLGRLIEQHAVTVAEPRAVRRLRYLGAFYRKMEKMIVDRVHELTEEYARFGPDEDLR